MKTPHPPKVNLINIANIFTGLRILLVPIILFLLWLINPETKEVNWLECKAPSPVGLNFAYSISAAILFIVASLTDLVDGYLARKYQIITNLGKLLDPLADKILVLGAMVMLVELGRLPAWMVVIILARELAITSLRSIAGADGVVISATKLGKYKTLFQVISLSFIIIYYPLRVGDFVLNLYAVGLFFFVVALFFTLWSGYDYFKNFAVHLKG